MVLRISTAMGLTLRESNELLVGAGLPSWFHEDDLSSERYEPARRAIALLLTAHEPFPALVLDPRSVVVDSNTAARRFFGDGLIGSSLIERFLGGGTSPAIVNLADVARAMVRRLRSELARRPHDVTLHSAIALLDGLTDGPANDLPPEDALVVCPWFAVHGRVVRTLVLAARFDTAVDVTLDELRIELVYPLDDDADRFFHSAAAGEHPSPG